MKWRVLPFIYTQNLFPVKNVQFLNQVEFFGPINGQKGRQVRQLVGSTTCRTCRIPTTCRQGEKRSTSPTTCRLGFQGRQPALVKNLVVVSSNNIIQIIYLLDFDVVAHI